LWRILRRLGASPGAFAPTIHFPQQQKGFDRMTWKISTLVAVLAVSGSSIAFAQASPDSIIAGRQAAFDLQGAVANDMKAAVESGTAVKPYTDGAKALAKWAAAIPGMFPAGTETGGNTKALPAIWSDRAGFEKAAATFGENATKLSAAAAADDKTAFAEAFKATAGACGACHRTYRAK
jgi:cytochrome c556